MFNVGVIGIGFLGGSLVKSLSKSKKVEKIVAFDKNINSLEKAYSDGVITDYATEVNEKFGDCDFVFICTPVSFIADYAIKLREYVKANCIITDIGSTKKTILENTKNLGIEFIGGHPMIGSERVGYETSKDLLFENSYYIITANNSNNPQNIEKLKELILEIGAIPIIIDAEKHDYITAVISHVPHVVASALVRLVKNLDDESEIMKTLAAGGFKDITRIASSDPIMWENICNENRDEVKKVLNVLLDILKSFEEQMDSREEIYNFFDVSKKYRDSFINKKINGNTMPELSICIKDENGAIASIATILSENNIGIKNIEVVNNRENNFGALKVVVRTYEERDKGYDIIKNLGYDVIKVN
ncbi:MAG: prephenate dehydrogenase/arogenate dehydrogenase family protein [Clostridia bacterium]|nr:prephenate dehydrogenase/arogenate dehydrogenase family protein [Clostridia bacterium]